ncbi:MAG: AEC family transporter [Alphaproteobacteria bacterium]|nr:AEC family transporter [Alphaproteobacteria bacterium]
MLDVLAISIPFFGLIFLGFGARLVRFCDDDGARLISKFAFFITLPPFMFYHVASNDPAAFFNFGFLWRYELVTILVFGLSGLMARGVFGLTRNEGGIFGLNTAYPNYGYMGVPLVILAFGEEAALPMGLMLFSDTIVLLGMTAFFVSGEGGSPLTIISRILMTMVKNPLLQAVVAGLLFAASGLSLPLVAERFVLLLAGGAAPAALFALGATVYGQPIRAAFREISAITIIKLVAHPLLVAAMFLLIPGQDELWIKVAIISACLPVAANVFMLSQVYDAYSGRTASAILASTVVATFTVPVILYLVFLI